MCNAPCSIVSLHTRRGDLISGGSIARRYFARLHGVAVRTASFRSTTSCVVPRFRVVTRSASALRPLTGVRIVNIATLPSGALAAKVEVIEPTGADTMLMCTLGGQDLVVVVRDRVTLRPGDPVRLTPAGDKLHVFDAAGGKSLSA